MTHLIFPACLRILNPMFSYIQPTEWDARALGVNTYEILYESDFQLRQTIDYIIQQDQFGHYTVKIDPLTPKKTLYDLGFYYCDTLIEPYCNRDQFTFHSREGIYVSETIQFETINQICKTAFHYDRFHRDFNLDEEKSSQRYCLWLKDLWEEKKVYSLMYFQDVAGFFAFSENRILLHALSDSFRGKGLAKYFWSFACQELFKLNYSELVSSISASNLAVFNLYASLGFKFRKPLDVYHWLFNS